jgi:hypothetical protein
LLCTPVVAGDDGDPYLSPFGLILTRSFLVTVRFNEAPIVDAVSNRFFSYRITTASLDSSRGSKSRRSAWRWLHRGIFEQNRIVAGRLIKIRSEQPIGGDHDAQ